METFIRKEAMAFANDFFQYSLRKRLPGLQILEVNPNPKKEFSMFTENIGKAIMHTWHLTQESFKYQLEKHFLLFATDNVSFTSYAIAYGYGIYDENKDDVFERLLQMSAFILELVSFCYERRLLDYMDYKCVCWTDIFVSKYRAQLFRRGGWSALKLQTLLGAVLYDKLEETINIDTNLAVFESSDLTSRGFAAGASRLSAKVKNPGNKSSNKNDVKLKNPPESSDEENASTNSNRMNIVMRKLSLRKRQQLDFTPSPMLQNTSGNIENSPTEKKENIEYPTRYVEKLISPLINFVENATCQGQKTKIIASQQKSVKQDLDRASKSQASVTVAKLNKSSDFTDIESNCRVAEYFRNKSSFKQGKSESQQENSESKVKRESADPLKLLAENLHMLNITSPNTLGSNLSEEILNSLTNKQLAEPHFKPLTYVDETSLIWPIEDLCKVEAKNRMKNVPSDLYYEDKQTSFVHNERNIQNRDSNAAIAALQSENVPKKRGRDHRREETCSPQKEKNMQYVTINPQLDDRKSREKKMDIKSAEYQLEAVTKPKTTWPQYFEKIILDQSTEMVRDELINIIKPYTTTESELSTPETASAPEIDSGGSSEEILQSSEFKSLQVGRNPDRENLDKNFLELEIDGNEQTQTALNFVSEKADMAEGNPEMFVTNLGVLKKISKGEQSKQVEMLSCMSDASTGKSKLDFGDATSRIYHPKPVDTSSAKYWIADSQDLFIFDKLDEKPSKYAKYHDEADDEITDRNISLSEQNQTLNTSQNRISNPSYSFLSEWKRVFEEDVDTLREAFHNSLKGETPQNLKALTSTTTTHATSLGGATNYPLHTKGLLDSKEGSSMSKSPLKTGISTWSRMALMRSQTKVIPRPESLRTKGRVEKQEEIKTKPMSLNSFKQRSSKQEWAITGEQSSFRDIPRVPPIEPHIFDPSQLERHGIFSDRTTEL